MKAAYTKPILVIAVILIADQLIKTWVRTHLELNGMGVHILGDHGFLRYTLNNGMAFGWGSAARAASLFLTIFRILAVLAIGAGLVYLIKHKYHRGLITFA